MTGTTGRLPETVGVYGGGRMGGGIAHAFAVAGASVIVVESDAATAAAARHRIEASLAKAVAKGGEVKGSVEVVDDPAALAACPLVVEAVPELVDAQARVLDRITSAAPDAVIGTNTSSLSIDDLADGLPDPSRLRRPALLQPGPGERPGRDRRGDGRHRSWWRTHSRGSPPLGKTAITVQDSPGFASSRLGVAIALEAMRMLDEGVATAADIDTAMTLGYRHPVGPLRTTDIVGLDVRLAIAEHLERELGPRFAPPQVLRDKVAAGQLGRKTGQGFYEW